MRPQTATLPHHQPTKIRFDQQSGNHYRLDSQGKEVRVNRRGELTGKFVKDFTGFFNFRERKVRADKDRSLMYTEPKVGYEKENGFVCPQGGKFEGYAQCPYSLTDQSMDFLQDTTYKEACHKRTQPQPQSSTPQHNPKPTNPPLNPPLSTTTTKKLNKFQSLKNFRQEPSLYEVNFDLIDDQKNKGQPNTSTYSVFLNSRQNTTHQHQRQQSVIMKASAKYQSSSTSAFHCYKRLKSTTNTRSVSSFCATGQHPLPTSTYFQQSLSNIQRTQTPNYMSSSNNPAFSSFSINNRTFNTSSLKTKCYKASCHHLQYVPKHRYVKESRKDDTVNIDGYRTQLEGEKKEGEIVRKLQQQLKVYQPVVRVETINGKDLTNASIKEGSTIKGKMGGGKK